MEHYNFRGQQTNLNAQLLILIDGVPIRASGSGGSIVLNLQKSLFGFKQIEVIRGTGSALHGADSFTGVINLVTKDDFSDSRVKASVGDFSTRNLHLEVGGEKDDFNWQFVVNSLNTDDDPDRLVSGDLQSALDAVFGTTASHAPGPIDNRHDVMDIMLNLKGTRWDSHISHYRNKMGLGPGIAQALDPTGQLINEVTIAKLNKSFSDDGADNILSITYQDDFFDGRYQLLPPGTVLPIGTDGNIDFVTPEGVTLFTDGYIGNPGFTAKNYRLDFTNFYQLNNHHIRWQVGAEYMDRDVVETKNFGPGILDGTQLMVDGTLTDVNNTVHLYSKDTKEHFYFLSIQDEWRVSDSLNATMGLRYDHYDSFGTTVNPRLSLVWQSTDKLITKLIYGSAYRAPTADERYFRNIPVSIGNEDLKPETIDSIELNLEYQWTPDLFGSLVYYQYKAEDIINYIFDPATATNIALNIGTQDTSGFEATLKWKLHDRLNIEVNYFQVNAESNLEPEVPGIPQRQAYFAFNWLPTDDWQIHFRTNHIADRVRPTIDPRPALDDYLMSYLKIQRSNIIPGLNLALVGKNIFDEDAREPSNGSIPDDYPRPGRQLMLEVQYNF